MRSSTTDGEKAAFLWFAGDFVETVAGRKTWGKQKCLQLMTEGTREGECPVDAGQLSREGDKGKDGKEG